MHIICVGFLLVIGLGLATSLAFAQNTGAVPSLPSGPQPIPGAPTSPFSGLASENYVVASSANEHGSYFWIVAPIQHVVILCEKLEAAKDFNCEVKRLP
jgi:hypothetical protein